MSSQKRSADVAAMSSSTRRLAVVEEVYRDAYPWLTQPERDDISVCLVKARRGEVASLKRVERILGVIPPGTAETSPAKQSPPHQSSSGGSGIASALVVFAILVIGILPLIIMSYTGMVSQAKARPQVVQEAFAEHGVELSSSDAETLNAARYANQETPQTISMILSVDGVRKACDIEVRPRSSMSRIAALPDYAVSGCVPAFTLTGLEERLHDKT